MNSCLNKQLKIPNGQMKISYILAMKIVIDRPIALWSHNKHKIVTHTLSFASQYKYNKEHVNLILQDNHFTSLNSLSLSYKFALLNNVSTFHRFLLNSLI